MDIGNGPPLKDIGGYAILAVGGLLVDGEGEEASFDAELLGLGE